MQRFSLPVGPISMAIAMGGGLLFVPEMAAADSRDGFTLGITVSYSMGVRPALGVGLDLRYSLYQAISDELHEGAEYYTLHDYAVSGAFLQATYLRGGAFRFAFGGHGGYLPTHQIVNLDGEIGLTFRTPLRPNEPGGLGLHFGFLPAITLVFAELAPTFRTSIGLTKQMGNEFIIGGDIRAPSPCIFTTCPFFARALRSSEDGSQELAPLLLSSRRAHRSSLHNHHEIDALTRTRLAAFWLRETSAECASIPAFLALARDLARVGAPASLVRAARNAANEEATHTRLCAALASEYSGFDVTAIIPHMPEQRDKNHETLLKRLARESFWDGCVGEGAAAAQASQMATDARDERTRETLSIIARDEKAHANLAADILRFCRSTGGKSMGSVLAESIESRRLAKEKNPFGGANIASDELLQWGHPSVSMQELAHNEAVESSLQLVG